jgi:predicted Rossmann-fold nucleotide-binding protein
MISGPEFEKQEEMLEWLRAVPYEVRRQGRLYTAEELYRGYEPSDDEAADRASFANSYDSRVYQHFIAQGKIAFNLYESVARTFHDHGIHTALKEFLKQHDPRRCIGIMGGHAILRTDPMFASIAMLSKRLTEDGFFMVSGGGPGAMEATHLGAWMAGRTDEEAEEAIQFLTATATSFKDRRWVSSALEVIRRYPQTKYVSLGIPTWLYGHEPSTPFATHIAKYFVNSVREDTILTVAFGGIIYTPGSAGTLQEIFQNAVQNHYLSFGFASPMIFWDKSFWTNDVPAYSLIQHMVGNGRYKNLLLTLTDAPSKIENVLKDFQKTIPY